MFLTNYTTRNTLIRSKINVKTVHLKSLKNTLNKNYIISM